MSEKLLHKFLNNEINDKELEELTSSDTYRDYIHIAHKSADLQPPTLEKEALWETLSQQRKKSTKVIPFKRYRRLLQYAAVFALLFVGYKFLFSNAEVITQSSAIAEKVSFTLPDTSEVVLNADSKISYSEQEWGDQRSLQLDGEAYFNVTSGKTFDVETTQGTVRVLGTQFNVQVRDDHFHVSCYEGLVSVILKEKTIKLPAGKSVIIEKNSIVAQPDITVSKPGWMLNESAFTNSSLQFVIDELQRQYNIDVVAQDVDLSQKFTGTFTHTNIEAALKTICVPLRLNYKINSDSNLVTLYAED